MAFGQLSPHFNAKEFACKCGCDLLVIAPLLVRRLEILRDIIKRPIAINSGFRCCVHNAKVKGAQRSRHTIGEAADIPAGLGVTIDQARAAGFTGIGYRASDRKVVHVDVRASRTVVTWAYGS